MTLLIDEARALEPNEGPWKVAESDAWGDDWPILMVAGEDDDGKKIHVCTDSIGVSEMNGAGPRDDAAFVVWCRNHWGSILSALEMTVMPSGTDAEKAEAYRKLASWNKGEPIHAPSDAVVLEVQEA